MPLFVHSGAGSTDLGSTATGTVRRDISDLLLASLITENNFIGSLQVGEDFGDTSLTWVEDSLNAQTLKDNTAGGLAGNAGAVTFTAATSADAGVLEIGAIIVDETIGDFVAGEQLQVTNISGQTITVARGFGGTTIVAHANGSFWRVVARPTYENSDLGRDKSKARISKTNIIQRFERNVNISLEAILRAKYNYAPGVPNEMKYQFEQRLRELLQEMNNAAMYSRQVTGGTTTGDYSTFGGLVWWLDGVTGNTTAIPFNAAGQTLTDTILNNQNRTLVNNGATVDWLFGGTRMADNLSKLYNDRIRLVQDDTTRGFKVKEFDTTLQNTLRIMWDRQIYDNDPTAPGAASTSNNGIAFLLDSGRIRIRPFLESLFFTIQAPSFRAGDAVRMLSYWSMEVRNTGTDAGAAHLMMRGLNF